MEPDKAKEILKECSGITKFVLAGGIAKVHGLQADAMNRLAELKNELPKALAQRALEEKNDVDRIKTEMAGCEEVLKDAPLTLEELTKMQAANDKRIKESQTVIEKYEYRQKYDALKNDLRSNSYSDGEVDNKLFELKKLAHNVDHYGDIQHDLERFLEELQKKYKRYRISR